MFREKRCVELGRQQERRSAGKQENKTQIKPNNPQIIPKGQLSPAPGSSPFQRFSFLRFCRKKPSGFSQPLGAQWRAGRDAAAAASPCVCRPHAGGARTSARKTVHRTVFFSRLTRSGFEPLPAVLFLRFLQKNRVVFLNHSVHNGALEGTRTPGLLVRSQTLYPAELPAHLLVPKYIITNDRGCQVLF